MSTGDLSSGPSTNLAVSDRDGLAVLDIETYRLLFQHMLNGMAYCRMILRKETLPISSTSPPTPPSKRKPDSRPLRASGLPKSSPAFVKAIHSCSQRVRSSSADRPTREL